MRSKQLVAILILSLWGLVACQSAPSSSPAAAPPLEVEVEVSQPVALVLEDASLAQADAIFLGRVDVVGETMWSEAGGGPYHHVAVTVLQPLVDEVALGSGTVLTVNGRSPQDTPTHTTGAMRPAAAHQLTAGMEAIFIIQETAVNGANGRHIILAPVMPLTHSIVEAGRLPELMRQVQQQRPWRAAPPDAY